MEKKKQIKVVYVETFRGIKYVLRLDKEYEEAFEESFMKLFRNLFGNGKLGSIAHISLRLMNSEEYVDTNPSPDFFTKQKGKEDGKEKDSKLETEEADVDGKHSASI